jgi:hypothetical protein
MYNLIRPIIRSMGFCCTYAFIRAVRGRSHGTVSRKIGLSPTTIRLYRYDVRDGRCVCPQLKNCALKAYEEIPRVDLNSLGKGGSDPFV